MRVPCALACVVAMAGSARADEPKVSNKQRADVLFELGRKQLEDKQFEQACATFQAAFDLDPKAPGTMLNLGLCNEELHHYSVALGWFRKAANSATELGFDQSFSNAAKEHTAKLVKLVATITIVVHQPAPANMVIKVDSEQISERDLAQVEVDTGHHNIVAKAANMKVLRKSFDITSLGSDQAPIELVFEPGESSIVVDRGRKRRLVAIYTAVGGGALMVLGGAYSALYKSKFDFITSEYGPLSTAAAPTPNTSNQQCFDSNRKAVPGADGVCGTTTNRNGPFSPSSSPFAQASKYANNISVYGNTLFFTGVAAVAGGIVLYLTAPSKERREETVFVPVVAPNQLGFAATRRF
jgi:hypothetical protein